MNEWTIQSPMSIPFIVGKMKYRSDIRQVYFTRMLTTSKGSTLRVQSGNEPLESCYKRHV